MDRPRRKIRLRSPPAGFRYRRPRRLRTRLRRSCPRVPCPSSPRTCSNPFQQSQLYPEWRLSLFWFLVLTLWNCKIDSTNRCTLPKIVRRAAELVNLAEGKFHRKLQLELLGRHIGHL